MGTAYHRVGVLAEVTGLGSAQRAKIGTDPSKRVQLLLWDSSVGFSTLSDASSWYFKQTDANHGIYNGD